MRKYSGTILLLAVIAMLLSACQPTPSAPVVINKNNNYKQAAVNSSSTAESFSAPDKWTDSYDLGSSKVVVDINAEVSVPKAGSFNIYCQSPAQFSQSQAENMVKTFFGNAEIEVNGQRWTKSRLEDALVQFKKLYAEGKFTAVQIGKNGEMKKMSQEQYEATVKDLEDRIANAPETFIKENPDEQIESFSKSGRISLKADMGRKKEAALTITNLDEGYQSRVVYQNNDGENYDVIPIGNIKSKLSISKDKARVQAESLLKNIGVDYMELSATKIGVASGNEGDSAENLPQCYLFYFTKKVDGISTTFDDQTGDSRDWDLGNASDSKEYDRVWPYERITIGIDDNGVVQFDWYGNAGTPQKTETGVKLLAFEQIMDFCKKNMKAQFAYQDSSVSKCTYYITKITLGMSRIKSAQGYFLVPVWDFFGTEQVVTEGEKTQEIVLDGSGGDQTFQSFLTINALDGSVIDRDLGY